MTDKAPPQSRKLVPQKVGPVDKRRRPRGLTRAIRTCIDAIVHDRCTRTEACERAKISERALYLGLQKSEVATYWNAQVQVLRTGERAANLFALIDVRDNSANSQARVNAAKAIENIPEHEEAASRGGAMLWPGLQIVLVQASPRPEKALFDITPNRPSEDDRH